jgi:hypothetical protein
VANNRCKKSPHVDAQILKQGYVGNNGSRTYEVKLVHKFQKYKKQKLQKK